jgi:hypothetical protein
LIEAQPQALAMLGDDLEAEAPHPLLHPGDHGSKNQNDDDCDGEREKERHPFRQTRLERFL